MNNNVTSLADKRKRDATKRVKNLLQMFKPKTAQQKKNELINKKLEMHQKSEEKL
jgi:hypothetical protein